MKVSFQEEHRVQMNVYSVMTPLTTPEDFITIAWFSGLVLNP